MRPVSFHSTQAASQALQPMQVVVSMYFETVGVDRIQERLPQTEAEERRISRFCVLMSASYAFSTFTRKALYSGVQVLGSWAEGVSMLASGPVWLRSPANPQWIGKPICQAGLPSIFSSGMRLVTIATPWISPR